MTRDTSHNDAAEQANRTPDDATTDDIAAALEGRQLFDAHLGQKIDGCRRCEEKNTKRRYAGVDLVDETFDDGDAVTIHAVHRESEYAGAYWLMTAVEHIQHPQLPFDDIVSQGTALVRARARVHDTAQGRYIVDVDVARRSRTDRGPASSAVDERQQSYIAGDDDDRHPTDVDIIEHGTDDPPAHWPELDQQWLQQLSDAHTLEVPTYSIEKTHSAGANPWGDSR